MSFQSWRYTVASFLLVSMCAVAQSPSPCSSASAVVPNDGSDMSHKTTRQIFIQSLVIASRTELPAGIRNEIDAAIPKGPFDDDGHDWLGETVERVHDVLGHHAFWAANLDDGEVREITRNPVRKNVAVIIHVEPGRQYHLKGIKFTGSKQFTPQQMMDLFPISPGDLFDTHKIQAGLEALRKLYGSRGFINFTSVPETEVDETNGLLALVVEVDEGSQFHLSNVVVRGPGDNKIRTLLHDLKIEPGQVFDAGIQERIGMKADIERQIDDKNSTVALTIDALPACDSSR